MNPLHVQGRHDRLGWRFLLWLGVLLIAGMLRLQAQPTITAATSNEEFVGPFSSWTNVKTAYGATGNGTTDDTAAIQNALNAMRTSTENGGGWSVLYFPAGTYKITSTLVTQRQNSNDYTGIMIVGQDEATTSILYDGPSGDDLIDFDGWYDKISRITFNGNNLAGRAFDFTGYDYSTYDCISDCTFENCPGGIGLILGGASSNGVSETTILRCQFINVWCGVYTCNFNSMDEWVWNCLFENCGDALYNNMGDYHCFDNVFINSTTADCTCNNSGHFALVGNNSFGSKAFWLAPAQAFGAEVLLQDNNIYDTTSSVSINTAGGCCETLLDNTVVTANGNSAPSVTLNAISDLLLGNTYNVNSPVSNAGGGLLSEINDTVNTGLTVPTSVALPPEPPNNNRTIYNTTTASGGDITSNLQATINTAAAAGNNAVVHIPCGLYYVSSTVTVPANARIQIIGDGGGPYPCGTCLTWDGSTGGTLMQLNAPNEAQLRDFAVCGGNPLVIYDADNGTGRVYMESCNVSGQNPLAPATTSLLVDGVENDDITMIASCIGANSNNDFTVVGGPSEANGGATTGQIACMCVAGGTGNAPIYNLQLRRNPHPGSVIYRTSHITGPVPGSKQ